MRCDFVKPSGERCHARSLREGHLCFFHDPSKASERTDARRAGGRANAATSHTVPALIDAVSTPADVVLMLSDTMIGLRAGEIEPKIASAVGFLAGVQLKAIEQADAGKQLAEFRRLLACRDNLQITENDFTMEHLIAG